MTNLFERLARGVEAAQRAVGSELVAETHPFDLSQSSAFPVTQLRKRRKDGEPIVTIDLGNSRSTMTLTEFDRFVSELDAFRNLIPTKKG